MRTIGFLFCLFLSLSAVAEPTATSPTDPIPEDSAQEPTPPEDSTLNPAIDPNFQDFTFNVGILYSTVHEYETKGELKPSLTEFEGEIKSEAAFGLSLGFNYRQTATTNWFINGGLIVELPRKIDHQLLNGTYVATGSTSQSRLLYTALYSNFAYEVAKPFYLTAGAGLGSMAISHYEPELDVYVGPLFQAGVGTHFFDERFYFELLGRYQGHPGERDGGATQTTYDNISGTGIILHLKTRVF